MVGPAAAGRPDTVFVGRRDDMDTVARRLEEGGRLLTVVGPPGVGKTRLGLELGAAWPEPVLLCELAPVDGLDALCTVVGAALELPDDATTDAGDRIERIGRALAARPGALVLLDAAEHLVETLREALPRWLAHDDGATLLVTSREPLRIEGELVHALEPLATRTRGTLPGSSEAAQLFIERAAHAQGGYEPTGLERTEIEELVERLEGLPLAIELAAARTRWLGTADLRERLIHQLDILGDPDTSADPRATLRGAIDWSWKLLGAAEQSVLAQLSVFAGGFSLDAVEAVVELPEQGSSGPIEVLQALAERSLVRRAPAVAGEREHRFDSYESIREYAGEVLGQRGEREATEGRHASFYVRRAEDAAEQLHGPDGLRALQWLETERLNLIAVIRRADVRAAARAALALSSVADARGGAALLAAPLEDAIASLGDSEPVLRGRLLMARAGICSVSGSHRAAARDLREALEAFLARGEEQLEGHARAHLAAACWRLGEVREAGEQVQRALEIAREKADRWLEGTALRYEGGLRLHAGEPSLALARFEEALAVHTAAGDMLALGIVLDRLGAAHHFLGRREEAERQWRRALVTHRTAGNRRWQTVTLGYLAELHMERGDLEEATELLGETLRLHREVGDEVAGTTVLLHLGVLSLLERRDGEALRHFDAALRSARGAGHRQHASLAMAYRGVARLATERIEQAREDLTEAVAFFREVHNDNVAAMFEGWTGVLEAVCGDLGEAERRLRAAHELGEASGDHRFVAVVELQQGFLDLALAREALSRGDRPSQRAALDRARERAGVDAVPPERISVDLRVAAVQLERACAEAAAAAAPVLLADPEGRWFRTPGGERVSLERRQAPRAILRELLRWRREQPGAPVPRQELLEAGWPGESIIEDAASIRLRVAISALRKAGLEGVLQTHEGGYRLDPELEVVSDGEPSAADPAAERYDTAR